MSKAFCLVILICTAFAKNTGYDRFCGKTFIDGQTGLITTNVSIADKRSFYVCNWTIVPPENAIGTLQLLNINYISCRRKKFTLIFTSFKSQYQFCYNYTATSMSFRNTTLEIYLKSDDTFELIMNYSTRLNTLCSNFEFMCLDKKNCYNKEHICDGKTQCTDYSDEINCLNCRYGLAPCSKSKQCFSPINDRCDGLLHCPNGDDEFNCTVLCPNAIQCPDSTCITQNQICDNIIHCKYGYDENECERINCKSTTHHLCEYGKCINKSFLEKDSNYCLDEKNYSGLSVNLGTCFFVLLLTLSGLFITLVFKWFNSRRDINAAIENVPEIPSPPFLGPGEVTRLERRNEELSLDIFRRRDMLHSFIESGRQIIENKNKIKQTKNYHGVAINTQSINLETTTEHYGSQSEITSKFRSSNALFQEGIYDNADELQITYVNDSCISDNSETTDNEKIIYIHKKIFKKKRRIQSGVIPGRYANVERNDCDFSIFQTDRNNS